MGNGRSGKKIKTKNRIVKLYSLGTDEGNKYSADSMFGRYPQHEKDLAYEIYNAPVGTKFISWFDTYPDNKTVSQVVSFGKNHDKYLVHLSGHDKSASILGNYDVWLRTEWFKDTKDNKYRFEHALNMLTRDVHNHIWGNNAQIIYPKKVHK